MRTINISISDFEYQSIGLSKENWSFSEFSELIEKYLAKQALKKSVALAKKYNLSSMSMDEITKEVKSVN